MTRGFSVRARVSVTRGGSIGTVVSAPGSRGIEQRRINVVRRCDVAAGGSCRTCGEPTDALAEYEVK